MSNLVRHVSVDGDEFITPKFHLTLPSRNDFKVNGQSPLYEIPDGTYVEEIPNQVIIREEVFDVFDIPITSVGNSAVFTGNTWYEGQTPTPMVLPRLTFRRRGKFVSVKMPWQNFFFNNRLGYLRWQCIPVGLRPYRRFGIPQCVKYQTTVYFDTAVWEIAEVSDVNVGCISLFFGGQLIHDPLQLLYNNLLTWEIN